MNFDELLTLDNHKMVALSICKAAHPDVLEPVIKLYHETNMAFHLVDDKDELVNMLGSYDKNLINDSRIHIHHAIDEKSAAHLAVSLVANQTADVLMKGLVSTSVILKEVLNKEHQLVNGLLSHVALFDVPNYDKALLITDCAMNIEPDQAQKIKIIHNAVNCAQSLGINKPNVALLSAVEKENSKIQSTLDAVHIKNNKSQLFGDTCNIDGPLQYDLAISKEAANTKNIESNVAGNSDVLIVPHLDAGNILYKSLVYTANAKVAAMIVGAKVPIVLTSRADSSEVKYLSIKLAIKSLNN